MQKRNLFGKLTESGWDMGSSQSPGKGPIVPNLWQNYHKYIYRHNSYVSRDHFNCIAALTFKLGANYCILTYTKFKKNLSSAAEACILWNVMRVTEGTLTNLYGPWANVCLHERERETHSRSSILQSTLTLINMKFSWISATVTTKSWLSKTDLSHV